MLLPPRSVHRLRTAHASPGPKTLTPYRQGSEASDSRRGRANGRPPRAPRCHTISRRLLIHPTALDPSCPLLRRSMFEPRGRGAFVCRQPSDVLSFLHAILIPPNRASESFSSNLAVSFTVSPPQAWKPVLCVIFLSNDFRIYPILFRPLSIPFLLSLQFYLVSWNTRQRVFCMLTFFFFHPCHSAFILHCFFEDWNLICFYEWNLIFFSREQWVQLVTST